MKSCRFSHYFHLSSSRPALHTPLCLEAGQAGDWSERSGNALSSGAKQSLSTSVCAFLVGSTNEHSAGTFKNEACRLRLPAESSIIGPSMQSRLYLLSHEASDQACAAPCLRLAFSLGSQKGIAAVNECGLSIVGDADGYKVVMLALAAAGQTGMKGPDHDSHDLSVGGEKGEPCSGCTQLPGCHSVSSRAQDARGTRACADKVLPALI